MRILIAESDHLFRADIAELITLCHATWHVFEADNADDMLDLLKSSSFDVLFIDLHLSRLGMSKDVASLRVAYPRTRIIALGEQQDSATISRCVEVGLDGYIARRSPLSRLSTAVKIIGSSDLFVSTGATKLPIGRINTVQALNPAPPQKTSPPAPTAPALTSRQTDVLRLLAEGRSTKDIARRLGLAVPTVKTHLAAIYRQLGARSRLEAVVKAQSAAVVAPVQPPSPLMPMVLSPLRQTDDLFHAIHVPG